MATTNAIDMSRFCSVCARDAGLDAAGSAYSYRHLLAVEIPLPWPASMYSEPGVLPQELLDLRQLLIDAYTRGEDMSIGSLALAPDPAYSQPGQRRVISYRRPESLFASFVQEEYMVPEADVGPLCWALLVAHDRLPRFEQHRLPPSAARDLMVCTHGAVDAACAKFGFPTYRRLRQHATDPDRLRVWRVSHFGGHVFAPTLLDMPGFQYWGYVGRDEAPLIADHTGDPSRLRQCYRGWAGFDDPMLQVAEREIFVRHGWPWLGFRKSGVVLARSEADPANATQWADVRIVYAAPDGSEHGAYTARVEASGSIAVPHSSNDPATYAYPQYVVTRLEPANDE